MSDDEPHRVEDNEPIGTAASGVSIVKRRIKGKRKIIVVIGFDDNLDEFKLWDYLYDFNAGVFEMEAIPDFKNRIQYYEIIANANSIIKLRLWLMNNKIKYKIDKSFK